jgi:hypothetical protein
MRNKKAEVSSSSQRNGTMPRQACGRGKRKKVRSWEGEKVGGAEDEKELKWKVGIF